MVVARIKTNMKKHFLDILDTWAAKECTHIRITETLDDFGQIIDQSRVETEIIGLVGDVSFKGNNYPIGLLQPGDLCLMAKYSDNIIISDQLTSSTTRHDHIIFQNVEYRIEDMDIGYDLNDASTNHEPVFCKYLLRKVTI